jgi:hypothetical protein
MISFLALLDIFPLGHVLVVYLCTIQLELILQNLGRVVELRAIVEFGLVDALEGHDLIVFDVVDDISLDDDVLVTIVHFVCSLEIASDAAKRKYNKTDSTNNDFTGHCCAANVHEFVNVHAVSDDHENKQNDHCHFR